MKQKRRLFRHSTFSRSSAVLCSLLLTATSSQFPASLMLQAKAASVFAEIYVSPDGDDSNAGTLAAPLKTLAGARDAVRKIKGSMTGDINVYFRGGTYRMTEAVTFDTRDSAPDGCRIVYQAYEDEKPVFSGAKQVTGWSKYNDRLYVASLDRDYKLRNLYVNDHRANMGSVGVGAQGGYGSYSITAGQASWAWDSGKKDDGVKYNAGDVPKITSNTDDLEIVNGTTWNENIVCSRDVRYENGTLVVLFQQPYGAIAQTPGWGAGFSCSGWHTVFNAFSFVDSPGEFFFDKTEHKLYYYPFDWENMSDADVEAPVADQLVVIAGESTSNRVRNLTFSGLTFAHTDYNLTDVAGSHGKTTCQAAQTYTAFADSNWHTKKYEMVDTLPAMIHVTSSDSINFTGNVIKHTGADGISMTNDVVNSNISGNYITDITSSGITIGHPQHIYIGDAANSPREKFPVGVEGVCKNDTVSDNLLYDISVVPGFGGCAAVTVYFADSVKVLRNQVEKTAYNGIHLGWGWCNFQDSTTCRDNMICYNRVINCLNRLHDSGGIYTIGQMPGTVINENYVDGIPAGRMGAPTYGLHNDEGTTYIEEMDNVLDIDKNVTYTINCEDYGQKHHLTIKRTYATVNKMGANPPYSDIDAPIVVSDAVWPQRQYEICLHSGLQDEFKSIMPENMVSDANYIFPASCATKGETVLPIRKAGTGKVVWIAPDNTTSFKAGSTMTKCSGTANKIKTPSEAGEYYFYVLDGSGKILSKSKHLLRLSGIASGVDAALFSDQSGVVVENLDDGSQDVGYIEDGDYIGFSDVDFFSGADAIDLTVGSPYGGASVEVRLDAPDGTLIGTCSVPETGGWQDWKTVRTELNKATGKHDLYLVFRGGEGYLFNIQSWKLIFPEGTDVNEFIYGDLNGDQSVDARDLTLLKRAVMTGEIDSFDPADLNGDLELDGEDIRLHQEYLLGQITKFPAQE
ncbi:MAG: carbohydrate-binding protein [Oscillospiraceae bacterium]|nr:carbohydrate-binding protein [Oscillospiraceae bacterium]